MNQCKYSVQNGFTLTELLIVVTVIAILLGFAIPSFRLYIQSSSATAQANALLVDLNSARMEAVKTAGIVRVSAVGGNWSNGWIVATDRDQSGTINGTDVVVRQANRAPTGYTWVASAEGGPGFTSLFFNSNGYLTGTGLGLMFQLKVPDGVSTNCRRVAVALSGRVEVRNGKLNPCT